MILSWFQKLHFCSFFHLHDILIQPQNKIFINLISRHHQQLSVERSSKKSSEFYLSNENGQENNSIDSVPKMKLKSQSVSSSNTDPDNDGNRLLYGY